MPNFRNAQLNPNEYRNSYCHQNEFRCIQCGFPIKRLFLQYSPGNIRLMKCVSFWLLVVWLHSSFVYWYSCWQENCKAVADEYIECEIMVKLKFLEIFLSVPVAIYRGARGKWNQILVGNVTKGRFGNQFPEPIARNHSSHIWIWDVKNWVDPICFNGSSIWVKSCSNLMVHQKLMFLITFWIYN